MFNDNSEKIDSEKVLSRLFSLSSKSNVLKISSA